MLRLSSLAASRLVSSRQLYLSGGKRHLSSSGGGGGGGTGKLVAGSVLLTVGVGAGAVGYAAVDAEFRKTLQTAVPGSEDALNAVLGPLSAPPPPTKPSPSKLRIPGPVVVTPPRKEAVKPADSSQVGIETGQKKQEIETKVKVSSPPSAVSSVAEHEQAPPIPEPPIHVPQPQPPPELSDPPLVDAPSSSTSTIPESETNVSEEDKSVKLQESTLNSLEGLSPDIEHTSLEQVLSELTKEMENATSIAVESYDLSAEAVVAHINIMQKVLESNLGSRDDNDWNQVFEAASAKSAALKFAELNERDASASINNVLESIDAGRRNKTTATNPQLIVAEEAANRALYKLEQAKARISAVEGEARVVEQYRDLVEEGRQQFHREMASIMPDVKLGEDNSKLTEDELNMFITHAYRKVLHLQQELAKQQTLEQQRFKQALEKQRLQAQMSASEKMDSELERQKRDLEVEHQRRLAAIREDAETELRTQLRRQAAAHSDHIADVLTVQETELRRKHEHEMNEKLSGQESAYLQGLSALQGRVQGLGKALEDRAQADAMSVSAQKLWLACVGLEDSIRNGKTDAETFDEGMKPLSSDLSSVKALAGDSQFVSAVLGSISDTALNRGVYTEQGLKERFVKVASVARKVGSVGDEPTSLFRYGLSYLQSMLLVNAEKRTPTASQQAVDPDTISTIEILNLARFSLERGDTLEAVQYMGLLQGEPRRVASDWLAEARLHLEARQASQALLAHAASVGLEVLPK